MAQDGGGRQAHVTNGAVAAQGHGLALDLGCKLAHAVHDAGGLDVGEEGDVEIGVVVEDVLDAQRDVARGGKGAYHKQDDTRQPADLLEGRQAALKLRALGGKACRVVVGAGSQRIFMISRPIGGNHDRRFHSHSSLSIAAIERGGEQKPPRQRVGVRTRWRETKCAREPTTLLLYPYAQARAS